MDTQFETTPGRPSKRLTLRTLGAASLSGATPTSEDLPRGRSKQFALVVYLACQPSRSAWRDDLISLLWADSTNREIARRQIDRPAPEDSSRRRRASPRSRETAHTHFNDSFRDALRRLRIKLGDDAFGSEGADPIALALELSVDRDDLLSAAKRNDYASVLSLYAGPFLPRFELLKAPSAFGQWVEQERAHLRRLFLESANRLLIDARAETIGRVTDLAQQLLKLGELDDSIWISVFSKFAEHGSEGVARDLGVQLLNELARQEGDPSPSLLSRLQPSVGSARLSTKAEHPSARRTKSREPNSQRPFVARASELADAERAWASSVNGTKTHLHFVAPSGYGKSALLERARVVLRSGTSGTALRRTVRISANEGTKGVPYQFASEFATQLATRPGASGIDVTHAAALVTLAPNLVEEFPIAKRLRGAIELHHDACASALAELMQVLSSDEPLAIFADDLHWSDEASLHLLSTAWQRCPPTRLLILSASRTECEAFCTATASTTRVLDPLDERDVRDMLEAEASLPRDAWAREVPGLLHDVSEGSPLQIVEQLKLLASQRLLSHDGSRWRTRDSAALLAALELPGATSRRIERLSPESRDVLLLLAVAGSPLREEVLLAAIGWAPDELARRVNGLTERGFVMRSGEELHLVHDAHADATLRLATESAVHRAAAAVGRALFRKTSDGGDDRPLYADHLRQLQRAASLLIDGDDRPTLEQVFAHATRRARTSGDRRHNRTLGYELLSAAVTRSSDGRHGSPVAVARLVRALETSLPWRLRYFNELRRGGWALLALILVTASAGITARIVAVGTANTPRITLLASLPALDGKSVSVFERPLRDTDLASPGAIANPVDGERYAQLPPANVSDRAQLRSDGQAWVIGRDAADSGGLDIFELSKRGVARRITDSPGDDLSPSWSPDDAHIVFSTSRWNTIEQYDIATYDTLTHAIRQLTSGDDRDVNPVWSPDGSRIAFLREYWAGGRGICVVDVDGSHLQCTPNSPTLRELLHGWITAHELLVERANDTTRFALLRRSVPDWTDRVVDPEFVSQKSLQLSPDGRWIACRCAWRSRPSSGWTLFPLDAPQSAQPIAVPDSLVERVSLTWLEESLPHPSVVRLAVQRGPGDVLVDVPYQLEVTAYNARGTSVDVGAVRWRGLDAAMRIDSFGVVFASHPGQFRAEVSAGGWTTDTVTLTAQIANSKLLLDERWTHSLSPVWVPFGLPRPEIVDDSMLGPAFFNNGDRYYFSGAYSASSFDVREGLWVEATISTPINRHGQWQEQLLTLFAASDSTWLSSWNHVNGDMTPGDCRVYFPSGDGAHHGDSIFVQNPKPGPRFSAPPWLRTGRPFRALIQVFPDGRCGFAVNGEVLWISAPAFRDSLARVKIDGRSVATRILVGPLRVASGIAPQVRWSWIRPGSH